MKEKKKKKTLKKIAIMILMVLLFQFGFATPVKADDEGNGGILLSPIVALVVALADRS